MDEMVIKVGILKFSDGHTRIINIDAGAPFLETWEWRGNNHERVKFERDNMTVIITYREVVDG